MRLRPKRYQCLHGHGNPTTPQHLSWDTPRRAFPKADEKPIWLSLVNSTVQDVRIKEDIGYEAIMGIIERHIERDINWEDGTRVEVMGLDEISLKTGHRDFVASIPGRLETETIIVGVLPDRKKATVKTFLSGIPQRLRDTIHSVCSDRSEGFVNAAKEVVGKRVKIVLDRFHGAQWYRRGVDSLRQHAWKRLKQEWSEAA